MAALPTPPFAFGGVSIAIIIVLILIVIFAAFIVGPFASALWERRNQRRGDRGMGADPHDPESAAPQGPGERVPNREQNEREKGEIPH